jgi:hypothetical protein
MLDIGIVIVGAFRLTYFLFPITTSVSSRLPMRNSMR